MMMRSWTQGMVSGLAAGLAAASVIVALDGPSSAQAGDTERVDAPVWLHVKQAPAWVARGACGRHHLRAAEVWRPGTDGIVYCYTGHVAAP